MNNCKNCQHPIVELYCAKCGKSQSIKRIDRHYVQHELLHLFHLEKGFLFTAKQMIINPGIEVREYLTQNRSKLMKPIPFLVLCSVIYSIVFSFTKTETSYEDMVKIEGTAQNLFSQTWNWLNNHLSYSNILMSGFVGFYVWLFFIKNKFSYFEVMTLICYVIGQGFILLSLKKIIFSIIVNGPMVKLTTAIIFFIYSAWAIGNFYKPKSIFTFLIAFLAYILGWITYITVLVIGVIFIQILILN